MLVCIMHIGMYFDYGDVDYAIVVVFELDVEFGEVVGVYYVVNV